MGEFSVQAPELALAASAIGRMSAVATEAGCQVGSVQGEAASFGGEPIGDAFLSMCSRANQAIDELGQTVDALSENVAMASLGYLRTDLAVVPISALESYGGFRP